jgi:hypothetical protein
MKLSLLFCDNIFERKIGSLKEHNNMATEGVGFRRLSLNKPIIRENANKNTRLLFEAAKHIGSMGPYDHSSKLDIKYLAEDIRKILNNIPETTNRIYQTDTDGWELLDLSGSKTVSEFLNTGAKDDNNFSISEAPHSAFYSSRNSGTVRIDVTNIVFRGYKDIIPSLMLLHNGNNWSLNRQALLAGIRTLLDHTSPIHPSYNGFSRIARPRGDEIRTMELTRTYADFIMLLCTNSTGKSIDLLELSKTVTDMK